MRRSVRRAVCTTLSLTASALSAQAPSAGGAVPGRWSVHQLESKALGDSRRLFVRTPAGYETVSRRYPVLIINDAQDTIRFRMAIANADFLADRGMIPPMLIVGIVTGASRTRDLTPASPGNPLDSGRVTAFLDFVATEALPAVRRRYRTTPYTVYFGHSLAGLAGLWAAATRPSLFNAVVASSPSLWWDGYRFQAVLADSIAARAGALRLFTSRGGIEADIDSSTGVFESRLESLRRAGGTSVRFSHRRYPDDFHGLTPLSNFVDGLRAVFDGYATAGNEFQRINPSAWDEMSPMLEALARSEAKWARSAREYPAAVTGEASRDSLPPEEVYLAGASFSASRNPSAALVIARRAAQMHPSSAAVFRVLGERTFASGDTTAATAAFRRALTLARSAADTTAIRRSARTHLP